MRKLSLLITSVALLAVTVVGGLSQAQVSAQQNGSNGIRISPVRTDLVIEPGSTSTVTMNVENVSTVNATFKAIINDFQASSRENGEPVLILDDDKFAPSHSLKRYINPIADVAIPAGSSKDVKVTITVPKDAAGGGYFGAVRFAPTDRDGSDKQVSLSASVGSLILVKVPGDIAENLKLESFDVRDGRNASAGSSFFVSGKNLHAVARFKNSGNVHLQPFGKVTLKKGGKVISSVEINNEEPRTNVLPDSIRRYPVKLDKVGSWGRYTVEGNFGYGTNGQLLTGSTSFMIVPVGMIVAGIALLGLVVFALFALPRVIKRYNAGVVRRANRR